MEVKVVISGTLELSEGDINLLKRVQPRAVADTLFASCGDIKADIKQVEAERTILPRRKKKQKLKRVSSQ